MTSSLPHVSFAVALLLTAAAAVTDLRSGLIPNRLVIAGFVAGVVGNLLAGIGEQGSAGLYLALARSLGGALACALLPVAMFVSRGLAGGDVKLFIAIGAIVGPLAGLEAQLYAFAVGALYALGLLAHEGALLRTLGVSLQRVAGTLLPKHLPPAATPAVPRMVRFAPAICAGTWLALLAPWISP